MRKEGADAFRTRVAASVPLSDYLLDELRRQAGSESLDGRARLAELARPLLNLLPAGVYRELLTDRLAQEIGLKRERLAAALGEPPEARPPPPRRRAPAGTRPSLVRQAITLLVNFPSIGEHASVPAGVAEVGQKGVHLLVELLDLTRTHPGLSPGALVERFRERPEGRHLAELLADPVLVSEAAAPQVLADNLRRIIALDREERLAKLVSKAESGGLTPEEKEEFRRLQRDVVSGIG